MAVLHRPIFYHPGYDYRARTPVGDLDNQSDSVGSALRHPIVASPTLKRLSAKYLASYLGNAVYQFAVVRSRTAVIHYRLRYTDFD